MASSAGSDLMLMRINQQDSIFKESPEGDLKEGKKQIYSFQNPMYIRIKEISSIVCSVSFGGNFVQYFIHDLLCLSEKKNEMKE